MTGSLAHVSPAIPQGPALARTPPSPVPDPWQRVLAPALRGQRRAFFAAVDALEAEDPRHPALAELSARGLFALGLKRAAEQSLDLALAGGVPSAFSLAALTLPEPEAAARVAGWLPELPPAAQADLRCDLAARALLRGDLAGAQAQIDAALCTSPRHAETRRWHRLITDARGRACPRTTAREHGALLPRAGGGWISEERWLRRITAGGWSRAAAPESGIGRLQALGTQSRLLAQDEDYALIPRDHPLVGAEHQLDQAISLDREGRDAGAAALDAWQAAARVDLEALHDCGSGLVALGVRTPDAAPAGLVAVDLLRRLHPDAPLWMAYEARLRSLIGDAGASSAAAAVLERGDLDPVSFGLAVDALREGQRAVLARRKTREALLRPRLADTARLILAAWDSPRRLHPVVSDRVRPRFASFTA